MRQTARIAAGMNDEDAPVGERVIFARQLRQHAQRRPARTDALPVGIGNDEKARVRRQQAGGAPPIQLAAIHVGLTLIAGGEDAHIPADFGVRLK